jgi:NAD(P)H dehydrogenase (quinone)
MFQAGTPYGATAVVNGRDKLAPSEEELAVARFQGRRVSQVATALKSLRAAG